MGVFSSSKSYQPEVVPTDEIILLHFWDTALCMRGTVLDISLKFDDVLDPEKLRGALDSLFTVEGWKQLGARLRMNSGKLEYHIPVAFDSSRPAYYLTEVHHNVSITDHPLGCKIPCASDKPLLLCSPDELSSLVRSADSPQQLDDWIYSDRPQLSIHIVSFNDATIITVTWIHTLADVMGIATFLNAWTALLRGDLEAVPKLRSFRSDPLSLLGQRTPAERYIHYNRVFGRKDLLCFIGLNILERLWYRQEERRTICLPASSLQYLCSRAAADLSAVAPTQEKSSPFVSESDVLLAWWIRTLHGALGLGMNQRILVNNALNLRTSLHEIFQSTEDVYMGNVLCMSPTFLQGSQIANEPLGQIALQIRQSLTQQRTTEQVEAMTALQMQTMQETGYLTLVGDPRMVLLSCSNWHKARLYDLDFSTAVLPRPAQSHAQQSRSSGKPSYVNGVQHSANSFRNVLSVIGKDPAGNWWLTGVLRTSAWAQVREQLDMISTV